jgi:hypothetical protein
MPMHALIDVRTSTCDGDVVWTSDATDTPLTIAAELRDTLEREVRSDVVVVAMTIYLYDEQEECVARWHWRRVS